MGRNARISISNDWSYKYCSLPYYSVNVLCIVLIKSSTNNRRLGSLLQIVRRFNQGHELRFRSLNKMGNLRRDGSKQRIMINHCISLLTFSEKRYNARMKTVMITKIFIEVDK